MPRPSSRARSSRRVGTVTGVGSGSWSNGKQSCRAESRLPADIAQQIETVREGVTIVSANSQNGPSIRILGRDSNPYRLANRRPRSQCGRVSPAKFGIASDPNRPTPSPAGYHTSATKEIAMQCCRSEGQLAGESAGDIDRLKFRSRGGHFSPGTGGAAHR